MSTQKYRNAEKDFTKSQTQTHKHDSTSGYNNQHYPEIDPDLQTEVDIPRASARTRTSMSSKSRKTTQSKMSDRDNIVRSRGRPIKPHEVHTFTIMYSLSHAHSVYSIAI